MNSAIVLQLRSIQNPFTVEIYPVSIETAFTHFDFDVDMFIQLEDTTVEATEGKAISCSLCNFKCMSGRP